MSQSTLFPSSESRGAPPRSARDLVAVLYREAGLIVACAFLGAAPSLVLSVHKAPAAQNDRRLAEAPARLFEAEFAHAPDGSRASRDAAQVGLKLDLDPGLFVAVDGPTPAAAADRELHLNSADAGSRMSDARPPEGARTAAVQAEGSLMSFDASGHPAVAEARNKTVAWLGTLAGLLLGLLWAATRELGGNRMRSPREAEWALGAPVLGTIPTLSAKARDAWFEASKGVRNPAPTELA